ncbi:MAG: UvrD-helicase domain-containing protein [Rikenellaceae bacterium]
MKATIYNASAGSGKTYRLAYKYVRDVIAEPNTYRNILAVTFTNKATEEMKSRILQQIHLLAANKKSNYIEQLTADLQLTSHQIRQRAQRAQGLILHDYSRFTVLTIDRFFQRVLRAFIQELGIDIGYNLEIENASIIAQSADSLIEQIASEEALREWLMAFVHERIEQGHKWDIHDGILSLSSQLFNEKARKALDNALSKEELQRLIAQEQRRSDEWLSQLKALGQEAMALMEREGLECESFKGKGRSFALIFRRIAAGELPEPTKTQRQRAESTDGWCDKMSAAEAIVPQLREVLQRIIKLYDSEIQLYNTAKLMRENYRSFALLADLNHATQAICNEQNTMLLTQTANILEEFICDNDAPFIYEKVGNRFTRFMIDEFQDTSRREWNNFLPLLHNAMSQSREDENSVLIVGDIKQSIYRWRGGDWRILRNDAAQQLGASQTTIVNMDDNYRSLPRVVEFNNQIIERAVELVDESLNTALDKAKEEGLIEQKSYDDLHSTLKQAYEGQAQNPRKVCDHKGFVEVVEYEQTPPIIDRICAAIDRGFRPCDIMILTQTNSEATDVAEMLLSYKNRCDDPRYRFDVMTQQALIVGYAPVSQFVIAVMQLAITPDDKLQRACYNQFLGRDHVDTLIEDEQLRFLAALRMHSPIEAFEQIVMEYRLDSDTSHIAYLQAIHEQIIRYSNSKIGDIVLFVEWWGEKGAKESLNVERSDSTIEILTIHKAKGLEKSIVIIPYCKWRCESVSSGTKRNIVWAESRSTQRLTPGAFPITYKKDMGRSHFADDYYYERVYSHVDSMNMLYVALTRAVESLHIFVPIKKSSRDGSLSDVGKVVLQSLPEGGMTSTEQVMVDGEMSDITAHKYGQPAPPATQSEPRERRLHIARRYQSSPSELRLRLPSQRYHSEAEDSPRQVGIMMHKAFEQATNRDDIFHKIDLMFANASIDAEEHRALRSAVEQSLSDARVGEWFEREWQSVRNESQIIQPHDASKSSTHRPDRVMIDGERVVVVDYKFGLLLSASHKRQMQNYMQLLRKMGYKHIEGYVWYVRESQIIAVTEG